MTWAFSKGCACNVADLLGDLDAAGFANSVGPGVDDIHSPRVPSVEEMTSLLHEALKSVPAERLWVNPDCGLKTRTTEEVTASSIGHHQRSGCRLLVALRLR